MQHVAERAWRCLALAVIQSSFMRGIIAAALLANTTGATCAEALPLRNAGFETSDGGAPSQSIPGWTLHGAPASSISVVRDIGGPALQISRGKAFCYGLALDPATDYVFSVRVRASKAKARIEAEPPLPGGQPTEDSPTTYEWRTIELPLPAAQRPPSTREMWLALGAEATESGGAVWYRNVSLTPVGGGPNTVPNPRFEDAVIETTVPTGWSMDSGGATVRCDSGQWHQGSRSLRVTGVGRPVRISQPIEIAALIDQGVRRVRVSGWGKCLGLGSDRVRLEVYGATPPTSPILSLSGDAEWMKGETVLDLGRQKGRSLAVWINAPRAFEGDAWFDDIRVEPVPDDEVVNLLSNASFQPSVANPAIPDYWGLWGDAVWCIDPWSLAYFSIVDVSGPVSNARVLQVHHPAPDKFVPLPRNNRLNMFVLTGGNLDLPAGDYTFSIYAKSDRPNTPVHIHHPASETPLATARVGRKWQRIVATSDNVKLLPAIQIPDPGSLVWLSAPQLEPGKTATVFRPSTGEGSIAPSGEPRATNTDHQARGRGQPVHAGVRPIPYLAVYAEYSHVLNDEFVRARLEWSGPTPATIHWRLLDAVSGEKLPVKQEAIRIDEPGTRTFTIPLADLPPGVLGLHAVADAEGKRVARATDVFAKLPVVDRDIRVNRFTRSLADNGTPVLPLFLPVDPGTLGDWHLDRLVKAGFNCLAAAPAKLSQQELIAGPIHPSKETDIRRQLDRLQAHGMKLLWPLPWTFDDWAMTGKLHGGKITGLATIYRRIVSTFRDHPAILGWYLMDEPAPSSWEKDFGFSESDLHTLWFAVKEADQGRPAYVNWNHTWAIEPYGGLQCTEIVGHDNYSTAGEPFDLEALVPSVRMVNDHRAGRKPAFAWIAGSYDEAALRPSADAVRVHAWLHLIYGSRGLGYWSKPPLDPLVWAEMKTINRDATVLQQQVLGNPEAELRGAPIQSGAIHHALWVVGDAAYLLAVNTGASREMLRVDVAQACKRNIKSGRRLFDDQAINLDARMIRDQVEPFVRRVYRFELAPASE